MAENQSSQQISNANHINKGYLMSFSSYILWGMLALYWKQIQHLNAIEMLAFRILLSTAVLITVVYRLKNPMFIQYIKTKSTRRKLMLSAVFIAINWGVYVYAVSIGQVVQASLGYYINPLISIALGVIVMKEKLNLRQYIAIGFATAGVIYLTFGYGQFPFISLALALSFGLYGLLKKKYYLDSLNSLLVEVLFLSPIMLIALLVSIFFTDTSILETTSLEWSFIAFAGIITVIPLYLFSEGAKRIPLSVVGFLQYIAPTMMLFTGVILYHEAFTLAHGISFSLIWTGLAIYTSTLIHFKKKS